jgi:hypothetical protein
VFDGADVKDPSEFRATSDRMLDLIDELRAAENKKRGVDVGSADFVDLAIRVEELSRLAFRWAGLQLQMAQSSTGAVQRGEMSPKPLKDLPARRIDALPGSPEAAAAASEVETLREEFSQAQERAQERHAD